MEHRRFHRITFAAPGELRHQGVNYQVRLENISLRGALVSSNECIMIPTEEQCTFHLKLENDDVQIVVTARVVHSFFSMVGLEFITMGQASELRLFELLKGITDAPDTLNREWQAIQTASSRSAE